MTNILLYIFLIFICWMTYRELMKIERRERLFATGLTAGALSFLYFAITFLS